MVRGALSVAFLGPEMLAFNKFWLNEGVPIVRDTTLSEKAKWAKVYAKFLDVFFTEHPDYYATFYSLDMEFWGSFYQMFETALIFYQDEHVSELVLGDVSSCPLLTQVFAAIKNKTLPFPNTVRAQIKQFYNALAQGFGTTTTLDGRLAIIDQQFGSFVGLQFNYFRWFQYVGLGNFGNFQQLVLYIATKSIVGGSIPENG
uniref:COesterase domain-containing protein n=1 Tax=Panagrellus redivivus TaxID=6233 RepID=A0A7E4VFY0_PANRE